MPVLGLAGCHGRKWKLVQVHGGDQSPLPPLWNSFVGTGIHNGPVPPASIIQKRKPRKTIIIETKEVLHLFRWSTHTPRCREAFSQVYTRWRLLSVPLKRKWLQNTGKNIKWINPKAHRPSSGNASMRRAWFDKVRVDSAKWLARWAKSAAEKIWTGCRERSPSVSSRRSSMAMLASLSLLRMFQRNVASWWIWTGGGLMSTLAMIESVSSMPDSCTDSGLSGASSWRGCQFHTERSPESEIATPVVGELGGLIPWVNPAILAGTNMADDAIEKIFRLPIVMVATSIHFRHHKSAKRRLGVVIWRWLDLDKVVCMELTSDFFHLLLEWIWFPCRIRENWSLMIGRRWYGCGKICRRAPVVRCVLTWSCRWGGRSSLGSIVAAGRMQWILRSSSATGLPMTARSPWKTTWHAHGGWRIHDTGKWGITFGHGTAGAKS